MKIPLAAHPFLFAVFSVLFLYSHNIDQSSLADLILPMSTVMIITTVAWILLRMILHDSHRAGLVVTLILLLFFSYGQIYNAVIGVDIGSMRIGRHRFLLPIWLLIFLAGGYFSLKAKKHLHDITRYLNFTTVILICISLFNITVYVIRTSGIIAAHESDSTSAAQQVATEPVINPPDIYYIILDGYANSQTLRKFHDIDNSEFIRKLTERGFYVARESCSNYVLTPVSLSSTLNMEYVNYLTETLGEHSIDHSIPYRMIRNNKVSQFLKGHGYKFVVIRSGWGPTDRNRFADISIKCGKYNEFIKVLIHTTMLVVVEKHLVFIDWHRDNIRRMFEELEKAPAIEGPKFVTAHILIPHPPFIFGANGEAVKPEQVLLGQNTWQPTESYADQLAFVSWRIIQVIDSILTGSDRPPIIIIQSDHGSASLDEWDNPSDDFLQERFMILNAYYLPDFSHERLYDSITPVNTFRMIFNHYFGTDYEALEDRYFFSSIPTPYKFTDVTERVRSRMEK